MVNKCEKIARCIDNLRLVPRFLVLACYIFYGVTAHWIILWLMNYDWQAIENEAVALAIAGFPSVILSALGGVVGSITNNYFKGGKNYDSDDGV